MIRPLRVRHRSMIVALAVLAPVLFVAGLLARQTVPAMSDSVVDTQTPGHERLEVVGMAAPSLGELPIRTLWLKASDDTTRRAVTLELTGPTRHPDLLVYWTAEPGDGALSDEALLLGRLGDRRSVTWDIPDSGSSGRLVLYSSAWDEVVASVEPPQDWRAQP